VHNGTIENFGKYTSEVQSFGTDSEACIFLFNKYGAKETINELRGAWCFVWFDLSNSTLNIVRNSQRPMHVGFLNNRRLMFFASEQPMMEVAVERNNLAVGNNKPEYFSLKTDQLYTFNINDVINNKEVEFEISKGYEGKTFAPATRGTRVNFFPPKTKGITTYPGGYSTWTRMDPFALHYWYYSDEDNAYVLHHDGYVFIRKELPEKKGYNGWTDGKTRVISIDDYNKHFENKYADKDDDKHILDVKGRMIDKEYYAKEIEPKQNCLWCDSSAPTFDEVYSGEEKIEIYSDDDFICSSCVDDAGFPHELMPKDVVNR